MMMIMRSRPVAKSLSESNLPGDCCEVLSPPSFLISNIITIMDIDIIITITINTNIIITIQELLRTPWDHYKLLSSS